MHASATIPLPVARAKLGSRWIGENTYGIVALPSNCLPPWLHRSALKQPIDPRRGNEPGRQTLGVHFAAAPKLMNTSKPGEGRHPLAGPISAGHVKHVAARCRSSRLLGGGKISCQPRNLWATVGLVGALDSHEALETKHFRLTGACLTFLGPFLGSIVRACSCS